MMYKLLNTTGVSLAEQAREILKQYCVVDNIETNQKLLLEKIVDYDILFVQLGLNINKEVLDKGVKLKIIGTATTGLDHIDLLYAEKKGVKVLSLRNENELLSTITPTAELAFGLIIDLMRLTPFAFAAVKKYKWERMEYKGHSLYGKTLGLVGLGRLGKWMARYGNAFNMKVMAYDPGVGGEVFHNANVAKVDFETLIKNSDIISIHVHLSKENENLFDKNIFFKMKSTCYLVNTSRGKIVNETDLLAALENKKIAGYATDVLAGEIDIETNGFNTYPLVEYTKTHNNCIIMPHTGGTTYEAREITDIFIAEKIVKYLKK